MKLNVFDGGKSVRVHPSLINPNEAVCLINVDNTDLTLKSCCGLREVEGINVNGFFYNYKNNWISSTVERSYVEYKDKLYFTEKDGIPKKNDGIRETRLGIIAPVNKLNTSQADPAGTEKISDQAVVLQYVYTYYNSQDGIESAPSPLSDELNLAANKVVDISNLEASTDIQVDKIRIYRIGSGTTEFTLFKEVPNISNSYRDDIPSPNLIGTLLESNNNQAPLTGLQFLIEAYGILFAALGDKLYFSKIGGPDYWPALNYYDFPDTITGLLVVSNGILVFSRNKTHILLGKDVSTFSIEKVSEEEGCISHASCKMSKNIPFWISLNGICTYGTGVVVNYSNDKLGLVSLDVVNVAVFNEQYFICLSDGTLLVMDLRFNTNFKEYKFDSFINNILKFDNQLYARVGTKLYKMFYSGLEKFRYKSPIFTEGDYTNTKLYNNIYMRSCGEFEVKVYIDDKKVSENMWIGDKIHDIMPNIEEQRGSSIQFDIIGTGTIFEIEYKVMGRQNGR